MQVSIKKSTFAIHIIIVPLLIFILALLISATNLCAQESDPVDYYSKASLNERFEAGAPILAGIASPAFLPDLGFCISGRGLLSFKTKRNNAYLSHSILPFGIDINRKGDIKSKIELQSYWYDDLLKFILPLHYNNLENHYWGVGFQNNSEIEKGLSTTAHHSISTLIEPKVLFRLPLNLYAGILYNFHFTDISNLSDLMKEDRDILTYGTSIRSSGMGLAIQYDSRKEKIPLSHSLYVNVQGTIYNISLGSDLNYQDFSVDYRHYIPVVRQGSILAIQLYHQSSFGDVSWAALPALGKTDNLRAIFPGRYRDKNCSSLLLEYRHNFLKKGSEYFSRHGIVFWMGGGTVYPSISEIENGVTLTGIGYRYAIGPESNFRLDFAFGSEEVGFYIEINESF